MSKETKHTTAESNATRRTVLRGAGVAGLLSMGVGTASAQSKTGRKASKNGKIKPNPNKPPKKEKKPKDGKPIGG
jgi:hypothetical protein